MPEPLRIDTVLFDLDGTLLDTAPDMAGALNELLRREDRPPLPYDAIRVRVSNGARALVTLGFGDELPDAEYRRLHAAFLDIYAAGLANGTRTFPGMDRVLADIETCGMRWGVVTNKPDWLTRPLLTALGLLRRTACVVSGDTLAERKPHPAPLHHACRLAGTEPARAAYIGDAERDIIAANAAGMPGFAALFGYIGPDDRPRTWGARALLEQPADLWLHVDRPAPSTRPPAEVE